MVTKVTITKKLAMLPAGQQGALPAGWRMAVDPSGRTYYQNDTTHETRWDWPGGRASTTAPVALNTLSDERSADQCFMKCGSPPALKYESDTHVAVQIKWGNGDGLQAAPCFFFIPPAFPHMQQLYLPLTIAKDGNGQPRHAPGEVS